MIAQIIDRVVSAFSPHAGLRRMQARKVMRGYQGGEAHRLTSNRKPLNQAADSELAGPYGADSLRAWARMLVRDNAYAWGVVDTIVSSVIGPGIQVESMCDHHGDNNDKVNEKRNKVWSEWAENCDITGQYSFDQLQQMAQREITEAGEVLIHKVFLKSKRSGGVLRPVPFALEIIEADRLANDRDTYAITRKRGGIKIVRGVEMDEVGKPVAYWIYPDHPNAPYSYNREPVRIEANKILHLFRRDRVGQSRGVTWFAPVVSWLRDLATYTDNELQASAVASCFTVAIKTEGPVTGLSPPSTDSDASDSAGNQYDYLQPGLIMRLGKNESIESANPGRPNSSAEPWINLMLRGIAVGVGLSYETVARDYSQTTYSSNRSSQLEDRRRFRQWQKYLIANLLQPVWDDFCTAAAMDGNKAFPPMADLLDDRRLHSCVEFQAQRWEWVDPGVEQSSSEASIKAFQTTYQDELAGKGANWRRVFKQRAREEALLKQLKLTSPAQEAEADAGAKMKTADAAMQSAKQAQQQPAPKPGQPEGEPEDDAKKSPSILQGRSLQHANEFWETLARALDPTLPTLNRFEDCGTGAGGFKPGNTCATGSAAADRSAVKFFDKEHKIPGVDGKPNVYEVVNFLEKQNEAIGELHYKKVTTSTKKPELKAQQEAENAESAKIIGQTMADEVVNALKHDDSAVGWYGEQMKAAMENMEAIYPTLKDNPEHQMAFKSILAITSNGQEVQDNFNLGSQLFEEYLETGKFPTSFNQGGKQSSAMRKSMRIMNKMVDKYGWEKTKAFLDEPMSFRDLRDEAKQVGKKMSGELLDEQVRGAVIFGPKLGSYYGNLNGRFDSVTMDLWFVRTHARIAGTLTNPKLSSVENSSRDLLESIEGLPEESGYFKNHDKAKLIDQLEQVIARPELAPEYDDLIEWTNERHNEYAASRTEPNEKGEVQTFVDKTNINLSAKLLDESLHPIKATPAGGGERRWMRQAVAEASRELKSRGIEMTNADIQAVLWYNEKRLYTQFGYNARGTSTVDYKDASEVLLKAQTAGGELMPLPKTIGRPDPETSQGLDQYSEEEIWSFIQEVMDAKFAAPNSVQRSATDCHNSSDGTFGPDNTCATGSSAKDNGKKNKTKVANYGPKGKNGLPVPRDSDLDREMTVAQAKKDLEFMDFVLEGYAKHIGTKKEKWVNAEEYEAYKSMSRSEKLSIAHYTNNGFRRMNEDLRENRKSEVTGVLVKHLDKAIEKCKTHKGAAYRLAGRTIRDQLKVGATFSDPGYSSASTEFDKAMEFKNDDDDVLIHYDPGNGGKMIPSAAPYEAEVLIPRGAKFRVVGVYEMSDGTTKADVRRVR